MTQPRKLTDDEWLLLAESYLEVAAAYRKLNALRLIFGRMTNPADTQRIEELEDHGQAIRQAIADKLLVAKGLPRG